MMKRGIAVASLLVLSTVASASLAAPSWRDRAEAKALDRQGQALLRQGKAEEAAAKFAAADEKAAAPSHKLGLSRALLELKQLRAAKDVAEACVQDAPANWLQKQQQKKCETLLEEIDDKLPKLVVSVFEPEASKITLTVDGETVDPTAGPLAFDPGEHEVVASAEGYLDFDETVTMSEGEETSLEISMTAAEAAADEPVEEEDDGGGISPIPAYVSWGVGVVGLGLGIGFGVSAIQTTNEVLRVYGCEGDVCDPPDRENREQFRNDLEVAKLNGNISTAGFVIGFTGLAAGTVLFLFSGDDEAPEEEAVEDEVALTPLIGPGVVGLSGRF